MRELTNKELRKLKVFRDTIRELHQGYSKTIWGRINLYLCDAEFRRELICDGIELFLTSDISEIKEVLKKGKVL